MLYIVPVPIGNLKDITLRALETLQNADLVLCEDTRKTGFLLHHFEISKKMIAFHKHNELRLEEEMIEKLEEGKTLCLVSDAGTPSINDPGASLIATCHKKGIPVSALPGPSAVTTALSLSGKEYNKFQFLGFFPKKEKEKKALIEEMLSYEGISIFFESPRRICGTLSLFPEGKEVLVAKELTKLHEKMLFLTKEQINSFKEILEKGEICVLVEGHKKASSLSLEDAILIKTLSPYLSSKDLATVCAKLTGKKKQYFYKNLNE
ncbi:16S rRNA (cytidine(1402)-2'-O)-methyltransferase [bacterium]|nr:16S rRNA (cytidine(1402)-2'-O)-methyltransferase [bacterium]